MLGRYQRFLAGNMGAKGQKLSPSVIIAGHDLLRDISAGGRWVRRLTFRLATVILYSTLSIPAPKHSSQCRFTGSILQRLPSSHNCP